MSYQSAHNGSRQQAAPRTQRRGILATEGGFALVFAMFLLGICTVLGLAAMQTSIDETDIASNELVVKKVFSMAESALPLASLPLQKTLGEGKWPSASRTSPVYMDDSDPENTATSTDGGAIQILDGNFLNEGRDYDMVYNTRWNYWGKFVHAPDINHKNNYKPIDDPFDGSAADKAAAVVDDCPDIRIRVTKELSMDVDVDKVGVFYTQGGVSEFGSGADAGAGLSVKVCYVFNCRATVPGKDVQDVKSPKAESVIGWRLLPNGI